MIQVKYKGRLGNQLFQYCFARILAERLGYRLDADPIAGFPGTGSRVPGLEYGDSNPLTFTGVEYPDIEQLVRERPKRRIVVNAYLQRYAYYARHLEEIREWLQFDCYDRHEFDAGPETLTVHVRLGDYLHYNWALLPEYYTRQIEAIPHESLVIVTDSPQSNFLEHFRQYRPRIVQGEMLDAFKWLINAKRLILSQSTFGWWAAILSDAEVWMPEPRHSVWSQESHIKLQVSDNPRWHIVATDTLRPGHHYT
jgi:hypothetical protein